MADTLPSSTPPNAIGSTANVDGELVHSPAKSQSTTCSCTKVSNMQLFHEMKQEFATVPDHIVWQYVTNNCHNRPECINGLKKEAESHPGSVQAYPQALRNNNKKPQRLASVGSTGSTVLTNNLSSSNESIEKPKSEVSLLSDSRSDIQTQSSDNNSLTKTKVPERPNTLNISNLNDSFQQNLHLRPTRSAPPPPTSVSSTNPFFQSTPSIPESSESLNVSLNVTVSPVSSRPPVRPPRHTTALSVQPETPPFIRDSQQSPRSFTSLNFTLRQPTSTPQSPIDISAGPSPSLTYSSSSYDARKGFQSRLEITVGGGGSSISASRTRPRPHTVQTNNSESSSFSPNAASNSFDEAELLHRQLLSKQRLLTELENDKKHLHCIQRLLKVLQEPLEPGSSQRLSDEIQKLRHNCNQMAQEVEEAGPAYLLGETNEAFYRNIYTGQRLPLQSVRPPRPQRPPPPYSLEDNTNHRNYDDDATLNQDGQSWTCNMCTFQNHPLLNKCEQCDMPLLTTTSSGNVATNNKPATTPCLQNISYQQQSAPPVLHNPFLYNQTLGFNDLHPPRLTQTQQN